MTNDADVIGGFLTKLKWRVIIENCQKKSYTMLITFPC